MNEQVVLVLATALLNGAVTWGVVKTQLAWLRRDVDLAHSRISEMGEKFDRYAERRRQPRSDN
jgi:hypothetical protein